VHASIAPSPPRPDGARTAPTTLAPQSIDELDAAICRLARHMNAESYRLLVLVRELDDRLGWMKWSFPNCAEWLAWRCGLSLSAAREKVRTAHALRDLPQISAAFRDGRLSYSKARALTRAAHAHDEDLLLAYALQATAAQVEERCRQIRNVAPESLDVARRATERRALSVWRQAAAGTLRIAVEVPIEDGELIVRALARAVEAGEVASGPEFDADGWHAQQADALVAIALAYLEPSRVEPVADSELETDAEMPQDEDSEATGSGTAHRSPRRRTSGADHYQVVVHIDETALRQAATGRSDLPLETVKRLTCDGSLIAVVEDGRGIPLGISRKQRTVPTPLKRALWSRDRGCSFPGCERTRYVDGHHVRHWAEGGETSLENLTLLCSFHHRLLHDGGFRTGRNSDGTLYFARPDGRVIPRFGYRADDSLDDGVSDGSLRSAEVSQAHDPSAETSGSAWDFPDSDASAEVGSAEQGSASDFHDRGPSAEVGSAHGNSAQRLHNRDPSAEVRDACGTYAVAPRILTYPRGKPRGFGIRTALHEVIRRSGPLRHRSEPGQSRSEHEGY
jgi:Domain of unknown function (DUF222)/HNH endonuclease